MRVRKRCLWGLEIQNAGHCGSRETLVISEVSESVSLLALLSLVSSRHLGLSTTFPNFCQYPRQVHGTRPFRWSSSKSLRAVDTPLVMSGAAAAAARFAFVALDLGLSTRVARLAQTSIVYSHI